MCIALSMASSSRISVRTRFCRLIYLCHSCFQQTFVTCRRGKSAVTMHFLLPVKPHTSSRDHYLEAGLSLALSVTRSTSGRPLSNETGSKKGKEFNPSLYPKEISTGCYTSLHMNIIFFEAIPEAILWECFKQLRHLLHTLHGGFTTI